MIFKPSSSAWSHLQFTIEINHLSHIVVVNGSSTNDKKGERKKTRHEPDHSSNSIQLTSIKALGGSHCSGSRGRVNL